MCVGKSEGKRKFVKIFIGGRVMLKWALNKEGVRRETGFIWLIGPVMGFCEHGDGNSLSVESVTEPVIWADVGGTKETM
jgi:hypothetical protein